MSASGLEARIAAVRDREVVWDEPRAARVRASVRRHVEARARRRAVLAATCGAALFALGLRALAPHGGEEPPELGPRAPVAQNVLDDGGAEGSVARR